jgi:hypothetical protein
MQYFIPAPTLLDFFATATVFHTSVTSHNSNFVFTFHTSLCTRKRRNFLIIFVVPAEQCCSYFLIISNIQAATARADNSVLLSYCLRLHRPARPVLLIDSRVNGESHMRRPDCRKTSSGSRQPLVVCGWMQCALHCAPW